MSEKKAGRPYSGSLAVAFPEVAATWHPKRNGFLTSNQVAQPCHRHPIR